MNTYCQSVFDQMDMAIESMVQLIRILDEQDLHIRPTPGKMSIGELIAHIAVLCKADFLIGAGVSEEEIDRFYEQAEPAMQPTALETALLENYDFLRKGIAALDDVELMRRTTAFWGGIHTRFEWLLDTQAHLYHHRGQLHAMMVHVMKIEPGVRLFE
ncbi:DinB family protein [Paenibacillus wulumuqiensis]|uniref:DinB family protein n=1 Tax=Paenibacillus wulumuqiensis TaxID=1567107 RepID=UPI000619DD14|nr:DinB family protein [Paenibacillus wulumuqiensis]